MLASDRYPTVPASLDQAEAALARLIEEDPSGTGPLRSIKGLVPGNLSFDDWAWVRLSLTS